MSTNQYFNFVSSNCEQTLMENLLIESLKIYGQDVKYLPRNLISVDEILGEDIASNFKNAYTVEMYIENVEGFGGRGDFMSKFGLEIRDEVSFLVSQKRFLEEASPMTRPFEGDLIYFPLTSDLFEIKFVEHESMFYELGQLKVYKLICEIFEYNHTPLETGNTDIDSLESVYAYTVNLKVTGGNTNFQEFETVFQGNSLASANITAEVFDWENSNTTLTLGNITGNFEIGSNIIGSISGAEWVYSEASDWDIDSVLMLNQQTDNYDLISNTEPLIISSNNVFGLDF